MRKLSGKGIVYNTTMSERNLQKEIPNFIDAINECKKTGSFMLMTVEAFHEDPELFYAAMLYAFDEGIEVRLAPKN